MVKEDLRALFDAGGQVIVRDGWVLGVLPLPIRSLVADIGVIAFATQSVINPVLGPA